MRKYRVPYLESRPAGYYFRLRFPPSVRALLGRSIIRLTLNTSELSIARERVATVLPQVYSFKRLCRKGRKMTPDDFRRALNHAVKRIVDTLESWNEPWTSHEDNSAEATEVALFSHAFGFRPDTKAAMRMHAWVAGVDIGEDEDGAELGIAARSIVAEAGGSALAKSVLTTLGIEAAEDSKLFADLSVEMGKLHVALRRVLAARAKGDHSAEERFTNYYRRMGFVPSAQESAAAMTPTITDAWQTYSAEKTSEPKPKWTVKTAEGQEATFKDWRDIIGNIHVGEVTRETMLRYRTVIAQLPANRHKRYPGTSIAELLTMEIPASVH